MISLLVPTRGRPENIRRLAASVEETAATPGWEIVWATDRDDPSSAATVEGLDRGHHRALVTDRVIPAIRWNEAWQHARGDILGLIGDDCLFECAGWDEMVEAAFDVYPDRLVLVYGPDGFRDEIHASHPFLSNEWANLFGGVTVTHFSQDYNDTWMNEVAEGAGRRHYIPGMRIQHMHPADPSLGVEMDQTYTENRARYDRDRNDVKYTELTGEREKDVLKLREAIRGG